MMPPGSRPLREESLGLLHARGSEAQAEVHSRISVVANRIALIVDDICDGGGTFSGIAQVLRANGAEKIYLCVTHGIFSKGIEINGIDEIFTTDSYASPDQAGFEIDQDNELESVRLYKRDGKVRLTLMHDFMEWILRR